jgi:hypothetical protein
MSISTTALYSCQYIITGGEIAQLVLQTDHGMDGRGSIPGGTKFFSCRPGSLMLPGSYSEGTGDDFSGVKRPESESDHSPPSSAEVKNGGTIPPLLHMS